MERTSDRLPAGRQRLAGILFLVSGAGLVVHIVVGLPLWVAVPGGFAVTVAFLRWVGAFTGLDLRRVVRVGLVAGAMSTIAYDAARLVTVALFDLGVRPFEAWRFFGAGLVGGAAPPALQWLAGGLFHLTNGLAFAVAYTFWFGNRGVPAGVAWGLCLEAFLLGLYPGWLHITDYAPFFAVSLVGHIAYGIVLGASAEQLLARGAAGA